MDEESVIRHLKDMVTSLEKDVEIYRKDGMTNMVNYRKGVKDGLELAIEYLEMNLD